MTLKEQMLSAPSEQMDDAIKNIIREKWDDEPTAIQILEVVDHCVYWGASSDFVVRVLNLYLESALKTENKTFDQLIEDATWRKDHV